LAVKSLEEKLKGKTGRKNTLKCTVQRNFQAVEIILLITIIISLKQHFSSISHLSILLNIFKMINEII